MPPAAPRAPPSAPQLDAQTLTPTRASRGEAGGRARRGRAPTSDGKPAPTCAGKGAWGHLDMEASPVQRAFLEEAAPSQQVSSNREGTSDSHSQGVQSRELPPPPWLPQGGGCNSYAHQNCPPAQARARGRSLASSGRGRAAHSEWDSWACPADTSHLQPVPRVGAREQRHALSRGQSSRGHPAEARARLGPAVLDPASRPWVTQVLSKVPPSSAASAVNRRSRFRTKQMSCDVPATAIFHTDTQEKCFIYILPSKEFEQQH